MGPSGRCRGGLSHWHGGRCRHSGVTGSLFGHEPLQSFRLNANISGIRQLETELLHTCLLWTDARVFPILTTSQGMAGFLAPSKSSSTNGRGWVAATVEPFNIETSSYISRMPGIPVGIRGPAPTLETEATTSSVSLRPPFQFDGTWTGAASRIISVCPPLQTGACSPGRSFPSTAVLPEYAGMWQS